MATRSVVGFVGLDDISLELATSLLHSGYSLQAFEAGSPLVDMFLKLGGKIISSGSSESITTTKPILSAMCTKLYTFVGKHGAGSKGKKAIELLVGIHFIASVEGIGLGAQAGVHPWIL